MSEEKNSTDIFITSSTKSQTQETDAVMWNLKDLLKGKKKSDMREVKCFAARWLTVLILLGSIAAAAIWLSTEYYACVREREDEICWDSRIANPREYAAHPEMAQYMPKSRQTAPIYFAPTVPKSFHIEETQFCNGGTNPKVIITVKSAIERKKERKIIRETWGKASEEVGVVFMVGSSKTKKEQRTVSKESEEHHDIVQGNYTDLFELLTYKNLNALYWVSQNCQNAKWFVNVDDNVLVDVDNLLKYVSEVEKHPDHLSKFYCKTYDNPEVVRKEWESLPASYEKYVMSRKEYPCERYPRYCSGQGWLISTKNVLPMMLAASQVKFMKIEDVYFTGHLARVLAMDHVNIPIVDRESVSPDDVDSTIFWFRAKGNKEEDYKKIIAD